MFDMAGNTPLARLDRFALVFVPIMALILYTIVKPKRLSVFLDALSNERLSQRDNWRVLVDVWERKTEL